MYNKYGIIVLRSNSLELVIANCSRIVEILWPLVGDTATCRSYHLRQPCLP